MVNGTGPVSFAMCLIFCFRFCRNMDLHGTFTDGDGSPVSDRGEETRKRQ